MPVDLQWDDDAETILHYKFSGYWQWHEFYEIKVIADAMIEQRGIEVALIMDWMEITRMPVQVIFKVEEPILTRHPMGTPIVFVSQSRTITGLYNLAARMYQHIIQDVTLVTDMDAARQHIQLCRQKDDEL